MIETKLHAIADVERGTTSKAAISKKYEITPNTLSTWINKILMSQAVFLLFLRHRFLNYNANVTSGSTWKFNRKQRKFYIFMKTNY